MPDEIESSVVYEDESLVQEESEEASGELESVDETMEASSESELETETETESETIDYSKLLDELYKRSVSENSVETETTEEATTESVEICTDLEEFENSTLQVDLYQYTILNRLEFMQYAICIVITLLFLIIFMRYKK